MSGLRRLIAVAFVAALGPIGAISVIAVLAASNSGGEDITPRTFDLDYRQQCSACGATFIITALELDPARHRFRVRITVENTGELGLLSFSDVRGYAWLLGADSAARFAGGFDAAFAQGKAMALLPAFGNRIWPWEIPFNLEVGQEWNAWFVSDTWFVNEGRPPKNDIRGAVGAVFHIEGIRSPLRAQLRAQPNGWWSFYAGHPYIELPRSVSSR